MKEQEHEHELTPRHHRSATGSSLEPTKVHPSDLIQRRRSRYRKAALIVLSIAGIAAAVYVFILNPQQDPTIVEGHRIRAIQLDVLNAAGERGLAQKATDFLREKGFDIVEMGNALTRDQSQTVVIDRTGNMEAAKRVAEALGVPREQVIQKIDLTLYLDVTVLIGRDYESLQPWR